MFTKDYAKEIFAETKVLIKKKDVQYVDVPKYDELSVKGLYNRFLELPGMAKYFPSSYPKGRQCDRDYMFNIANTLQQDVVQELIEHAVKLRYDPVMGDNKSESIMISDRWREELASYPLTNRVSSRYYPPTF